MDKDKINGDENVEVWRILSETRDALFRARTKELRLHGTNLGRSAILFAIEILGRKATPSEISRQLFRESHSVSKLLSDMEKEGLIRKEVDPYRKTVKRVKMTRNGLKTHIKTLELVSINNILSKLSKNEKEQLKALLLKLWYAALEELSLPKKEIFPMWQYHRLILTKKKALPRRD